MSVRKFDVPSTSIFEPILMLSAPIMLPKVPSVEAEVAGEDRTMTVLSVAPPAEVRIVVKVAIEPEQSTTVSVVPPTEPSRAQSSSDFFAFLSAGLPTRDREKMPATSADDRSSINHSVFFDIRVSEGESALANPVLVRWLIQAALLLIDRENRKNRTVAKIFSSFYPMIFGISFLICFFI